MADPELGLERWGACGLKDRYRNIQLKSTPKKDRPVSVRQRRESHEPEVISSPVVAEPPDDPVQGQDEECVCRACKTARSEKDVTGMLHVIKKRHKVLLSGVENIEKRMQEETETDRRERKKRFGDTKKTVNSRWTVEKSGPVEEEEPEEMVETSPQKPAPDTNIGAFRRLMSFTPLKLFGK